MINVAILGFGTVGSGVAEVLKMNNSTISQKAGKKVDLKYILDVRDISGTAFDSKVIHDFSIIESDPDVNVVVETIGGATVAYEYTKKALSAGKNVVTSNKELVATHGCELLKLAKVNGVNYLFEASCGGGIPLLHPVNSCFGANQITEIVGILNGTTNYILTRMFKDGISFESALSEAQANGYAERNPAADVQGADACRKICILSSLAFGRHIYPDQVPTEGITKITSDDVNYAEKADCKVKLLGRSVPREDGRVCAYVAPHLVPNDNPISTVQGVFNAITVTGNAVGDVMFYGQGAGKMPTASAVVADIIDIAKYGDMGSIISWEEGGPDTTYSTDNLSNRWYVRASGTVAPSGVEKLSSPEDKNAVFITNDSMTRPELDTLLSESGVTPAYIMRVLG